MSKVISLCSYRLIKADDKQLTAYENHIMRLDKFGLLEEMVSFQEERLIPAAGRMLEGYMSPIQAAKGIILFKRIAWYAETPELHTLATSYIKYCEKHLTGMLKRETI